MALGSTGFVMNSLPAVSSTFCGITSMSGNHNPMKDFEVISPPDDTVSCMEFSPPSITNNNFLIAGSWDNLVRFWEIQSTGNSILRLQQSMTAPVLDVAWSDDGSKVFMAGCDQMAKCWDLASNQCLQVAAHDIPLKTCHWIKSSHFNCLMTGSWDKTVKFWDLRAQQPIATLPLPERVYCADVESHIAIVSTAGRQIFKYSLDTNPPNVEQIMLSPPLMNEHRCISLFKNKDQKHGFAVGSIGGRVAVHHFVTLNAKKDNLNFMCHRSTRINDQSQDVYAVNDIKFHPTHGTMATAGSDGTFSFFDKDARKRLKKSEQLEQPVTSCCFSHDGQIFAYSLGYDWSKGHEFNNPQKKSHIFLRPCMEEMKPKQ